MAAENGRSVSWGWLAATLFGVLVAVTPYALRGFIGPTALLPIAAAAATPDVETDRRINDLEKRDSEQGFAIINIQAAQEREHKLLIRIARKMGIEVAE